MPLILPELDETVLKRPPLVVVICQVRYEQNLVVSDGDTGIKIHEQLGGRDGLYRWIEPVQTMAAQIEIGQYGLGHGVVPGIQSSGWRLKSDDGAWTVTIMPDSTSIETTAYKEWEGDFRDKFVELLGAITEHVKPSVEQRIGLRYVNRIPAEGRRNPADWLDVIAPELISPVGHSFWSEGVRSAQNQLELDIGEPARCLMRYGFVQSSLGLIDSYALDYDVFRQNARRFDTDVATEAIELFHKTVLAVFQKSLTPDYLSELR
jgi:uncharacterized protein (TIGR04255 family)